MTPPGCTLPEVMPQLEADLYERLRTLHCARKVPGHECLGRVGIDRRGMTLQCPLCGDVRTLYPERKQTDTRSLVAPANKINEIDATTLERGSQTHSERREME